MEQYNFCNGCSQTLPTSAYAKKTGPKANKLGIRSRCKKCEIAAYQDYAKRNPDKVRESRRNWERKNPEKKKAHDKKYAQKNKEKIASYSKEWRSKNKDYISAKNKEWRELNKDKKAVKDRDWARRNPDKVRMASKRYRENNPEKAKANVARYAERHPEVRRQSSSRRRARVLQSEIKEIALKDLRRLLSKPCAYCGGKSEHLDHVIPISRGGGHKLGNLIGACGPCNQSKGALFVSEWKLRKKKNGY